MTEYPSSYYRQEYGRQAGFIRVSAILLSFSEGSLRQTTKGAGASFGAYRNLPWET